MSDRLLYAVNVPNDAQMSAGSQNRRQLAKQAFLEGGSSSTQSIASQPSQQTLRGQVRGRYAQMIATMLEELFSSGIDAIPFVARDGQTASDGYYAPDNVSLNRLDAREDRLQQFDGVLSFKGTKHSHWRAVTTNPQSVDNPFGTGAAPEVGLSVQSSKVQWFDPVGGAVSDATAQRTVEGEHGQIEIYDTNEPGFDSPALIYDIGYTEEYPTDCVVWDTYNRPKVYQETTDSDSQVGTATVGTATVTDTVSLTVDSQWQRVFAPDHDWRGDMVLETDRLRLWVDQPDDTFRAYRYDGSGGQYNLVQLGASDWRLWDVDLTHIGLARIEAQFGFENQSTGERYALNATLVRGLEDVIWSAPTNEGATPQGLIDRLDPIASTTDYVAVPSAGLVKRSEVHR